MTIGQQPVIGLRSSTSHGTSSGVFAAFRYVFPGERDGAAKLKLIAAFFKRSPWHSSKNLMTLIRNH
jgi:hypothetical protein